MLFLILVLSLNKLCNADEAHCSSPVPSPQLPRQSFGVMCCKMAHLCRGMYPVELICTTSYWYRRDCVWSGGGLLRINN